MRRSIIKKIVIYVIIMLLCSATISFSVTQSDINNQQSQKNENNKKITETEEKKEEVKEIKDQTLKEVETLTTQITDYQNQINELDSKIENANNKIKEAEQKIKEAEEDYKKQQDTLEQRLVAVYEAGETSFLDFLLNSESLTDFISNYYILSEVTEYDNTLLEQIEAKKKEIETSKEELEKSKAELTTAKGEKEKVSVQLKTAKTEKDNYASQLSEEEKELQSKIDQLQQDNVSIDKAIKSMQSQIEAAKKAAVAQAAASKSKNNSSTGSSSGGTSSGTSTANTASKSSAGFIRPVNSYVTTGWYYSSGRVHGAVDFGAGGISGSPVYAVADGIVISTAALTTSYGNYIILYHPSSGLFTLYAHGQAGSIAVSQGQSVSQGQQIMRVGSTGNSTGPHLHFEVRTGNGTYSERVNPLSYLP